MTNEEAIAKLRTYDILGIMPEIQLAIKALELQEIVYCKDCIKHNVSVEDTWNVHKQWCPLVETRGKAQGHEFDYQYCAYGERRQDE